ncbi:MAG: hypothetical protein ABI763_08580 [Bacteroidota bacterium]
MKSLFLAFVIGVFFWGCSNQDTYPIIPSLEFKSLTFGDKGRYTFTLTATFTDGDGDIGYYQDRPNDPVFDDTLSQYYYNFVLNLQVLKNGVWADSVIVYTDINFNVDSIASDNDTTYTYYNDLVSLRLPYLTQDGQNKGLKGDIEKSAFLPIPFFGDNPFVGDTIRFRAFIYDRALHKSNEIFTPGYLILTP